MRQKGFTEGHKGRKRRHIGNTILAWLLVLAVIVIIILIAFQIVRGMGYRSLRDNVGSEVPRLEMTEESVPAQTASSESILKPEEEAVRESDESPEESEAEEQATPAPEPEVEWQADWVRYNGKVYDYNDDILTFLFLGIDKMGPVEPNADLVSGGQADAIFLIVLNPDTGKVSLIGVNRDTMVDVTLVGYSDANGSTRTANAQLAVQHGFGDGMGQSCELTKSAVSKLFFNLPIHGYVSYNMGGIGALNDALGGVRLTVQEDMTKVNASWTQGTEVTLMGRDAYDYIHFRDTTIFESARNRLARQKQYLSGMVSTALEGTKRDLTLPLTLYQAFSPYIVTDLSVDEITYLASVVADYEFDSDAIYTMAGETVKGAQFEEFYPDEAALKDLMIRLFYREVNPLTGEYVPFGG